MAGLFTKPPNLPPVKPPPDMSDAEVAANAAELRKQLLAGKGTSALTGGSGAPGGQYSGSRLLGAGA